MRWPNWFRLKRGKQVDEFGKLTPTFETLASCERFEEIDAFMGETGDGYRLRLRQSEDVRKWVRNPGEIETIRENLSHFKKIISQMPPPVRLLDVGCYAGYLYDYAAKIARLNPQHLSYLGLDVREDVIRDAAALHSGLSNCCFKVGDIYELENAVGTSSYDIVFCSRVLIHIPHFEKAVHQLLQVAKDILFLVIVVGEKDYCNRNKRVIRESGEETITYFRGFSRSRLEEISNRYARTLEIREGSKYASVIFRRLSKKEQPSGA